MKYFSRPYRDSMESEYLAVAYGKSYEPFGTLSLSDEAELAAEGVVLESLAGEMLVLHPESAAWAFLNEGELHWFSQLNKKPFGWLRHNLSPYLPAEKVLDFVAHLYRRGLLTINLNNSRVAP